MTKKKCLEKRDIYWRGVLFLGLPQAKHMLSPLKLLPVGLFILIQLIMYIYLLSLVTSLYTPNLTSTFSLVFTWVCSFALINIIFVQIHSYPFLSFAECPNVCPSSSFSTGKSIIWFWNMFLSSSRDLSVDWR